MSVMYSPKIALRDTNPPIVSMKRLFKIALISCLSAGTAAALFFLSLGILVSQHAANPEKSDVIVVLGGDSGLRVRKGAELYKAGYATHVVLTGIDERFYRPAHLNWRERRMRALGVPQKAIIIDAKSKTTWDEAINTSKMMESNGWQSAIVVSDPPHMLRLHQTWSRAFEGSPKTFILVSTNPLWWHRVLWWKERESYQFVISEVKKNIFYAAVHY